MTIGSHQATVGKSQTHLTPRFILEALPKFDLDPCAAFPRPWDCATVNLSEKGLEAVWTGSVWCNPPFNRYEVGKWVERMCVHKSGVLLLHARTETAWFSPIWQHADAILFLGQRLKFCLQDGTPQAANSGAPVVLAAFGDDWVKALYRSALPGAIVENWTWTTGRKRHAHT